MNFINLVKISKIFNLYCTFPFCLEWISINAMLYNEGQCQCRKEEDIKGYRA